MPDSIFSRTLFKDSVLLCNIVLSVSVDLSSRSWEAFDLCVALDEDGTAIFLPRDDEEEGVVVSDMGLRAATFSLSESSSLNTKFAELLRLLVRYEGS
jgi:hypothetical protein